MLQEDAARNANPVGSCGRYSGSEPINVFKMIEDCVNILQPKIVIVCHFTITERRDIFPNCSSSSYDTTGQARTVRFRHTDALVGDAFHNDHSYYEVCVSTT